MFVFFVGHLGLVWNVAVMITSLKYEYRTRYGRNLMEFSIRINAG